MNRKNFLAIVAGHIIERYDVIITGFYSSTLSPIFFPKSDPKLTAFFVFGSFASGFIMRPLGGLIYGHFGDKYGRRHPFINSLLWVSITTLIIAILPPYERIGAISSIIFIILRLLQGLCIGGEYAGAIIYFYESMIKNKIMAGSLICASGFLGGVIGLLLSAICTLYFMPAWVWRIPFFFGGCFGLICYFHRMYISETVSFKDYEYSNKTLKYPLSQVIRENKKALIATILIGAYDHLLLNLSTIFLPNILMQAYNLPIYKVAIFNTLIWLLWMNIILFTGYICQFIQQYKIMYWSSLLLLVTSVMLYFILPDTPDKNYIILLEVILFLLGATYFSSSSSYIPSLFLIEERYSGIAFGLNVGQAFIGSFIPLWASLVVTYTHTFRFMALVLFGCGIVGYLGIVIAKYCNSTALNNTYQKVGNVKYY